MSINARLRKLEAAIASRNQQQDYQTIQQKIESLKDVPYEQLLTDYHAALNQPVTDPVLIAKLAEFETMDCDQLIRSYMQACRT